VHVIQIGLGTNSTFIQNYAGWYGDWDKGLDWVLQSVSKTSPQHLTGVAVEPVAEHAQALRPTVERSLPGVALLQCAIGDTDSDSQVHLLTKSQHDAVLRQVPWWHRKGLAQKLVYLLNMSCVGTEHPEMQRCLKAIWEEYSVQPDIQQARVGVWSWNRLARELNFGGCEVLVVDTEGFDARILKSMIAHCSKLEIDEQENVWPYVIQFETQGHCDKLDGRGAEWGIIGELENAGYVLVHYSTCNTHLARKSELWHNKRVTHWARTLVCERCGAKDSYPYLTSREMKVYCQACVDG